MAYISGLVNPEAIIALDMKMTEITHAYIASIDRGTPDAAAAAAEIAIEVGSVAKRFGVTEDIVWFALRLLIRVRA